MNANFLAPLALGMSPIVVLIFYAMYRPPVATLLSLIYAELLLPPWYSLPIWPYWLSKWIVVPFAAGLASMIYGRAYLRKTKAFRGVEAVFLIGVFGNFMTWVTNRDPVSYGPVTLSPHTFKDALVDNIRLFTDPWILFYLGRAMFRSTRELHTLFRMMGIAMGIYTLPILYEIRMSPSINRIVYGYNPSNFDMTYRWGGYRPQVFFHHGLALAAFTLTCTVMVVGMARAHLRIRNIPMKAYAIYLLFILVICKSTGAIGYGLILAPLVAFVSPKRILTVAWIFGLFFLFYPVIRGSNVIPTADIAQSVGGLSTERAGSLWYRFAMEDGMFDLTMKRPLFGWGAWDRNFVHDPVTGEKVSVPDGQVIGVLSSHGLVGFVSYYFPFVWTVIRAPKLIKRIKSKQSRILLACLAVVCAMILFDLTLNSAFFPLFMLLFGALYGLPRGILAEEAAAERQALEAHALGQEPYLPAPVGAAT